MRRKYDKYLMCNFGYIDEQGYVSLIYDHVEPGNGQKCQRCGELLHTKLVHVFHEETQSEKEWLFGSTCVGYVFGAGLKS